MQQSLMNGLIVAPCSRELAKYACENFHYLHKIAQGKIISHGVWENNQFIGAIVYAGGGKTVDDFISEIQKITNTNYDITYQILHEEEFDE